MNPCSAPPALTWPDVVVMLGSLVVLVWFLARGMR